MKLIKTISLFLDGKGCISTDQAKGWKWGQLLYTGGSFCSLSNCSREQQAQMTNSEDQEGGHTLT